jgi:hypothetical protein
MTRSYAARWVLALAVLLTLFVTLPMLSGDPLSAQDSPTATPEATSEPFEATFGPGPFNLMLPTEGLSGLSSYRATLTLSFEGTHAGQPEQWSRTYTMLVTQIPPARQLTIEKSEDAPVYMAEVNGTYYERRGEDACTANAVEAEGAFAETWEPAGFLDSVIGADEAGTDTVNGVAANHYTFDERAQGALDIAESTGEIWIASDGGYLVRYALVTTGGADYFGEGIEGTLTWDYELDDVNQPLVIEVPDDCPAGMLDVPVLSNAADVLELPGYTSYTTPSGMEDAITFYEEQVAALGGQPANPPTITENTALFGFTLNDQPILLIVSSDSGMTRVDIYRMANPTELAFAAEVPDTRPAETVPDTTSGDCPAGAVPIPVLPDATDVQTFPGLFAYTTSTSMADAVAFYEEQVAALEGQVSYPMPASEMMAVMDVQQGGQIFSVMILSQGGITSVTITSGSGSPLVPASDCPASE